MSNNWSEPIEVSIFLSEYGVEGLNGDPQGAGAEKVIRNMSIPSYGDECVPDKWTRIGRAQISISLLPNQELVSAQVEALQRQEREIQAAAQAKCTDIRRKINTLLAITNEVRE